MIIINIETKLVVDDILNIPTKYAVTTEGEVYDITTWEQIVPYIDENGYYRVYLNIDGNTLQRLVHRLVAIAFIPNPNNYPYVNHKDGNKLNPNLTNLEWKTPQGNVQHAIAHGLRGKLTCELVARICLAMQTGNYTQNELAKMFNVQRYDISCIKNHANWRGISDLFDVDNCKVEWNLTPELKVVLICEMIMENKLMLDEIAEKVGVSHGVVCDIYHKRNFKRITSKYDFSNYDKYQRYEHEFLDKIRQLMIQGYSNVEIREILKLEKGCKTNTLLYRQRQKINKIA